MKGRGKFTPSQKNTVPVPQIQKYLAWIWANTSWIKFHFKNLHDVTEFLLTSAVLTAVSRYFGKNGDFRCFRVSWLKSKPLTAWGLLTPNFVHKRMRNMMAIVITANFCWHKHFFSRTIVRFLRIYGTGVPGWRHRGSRDPGFFFTSRLNLIHTSARNFQSNAPNIFGVLMFVGGGKFPPPPPSRIGLTIING